MKEIIKRLSKIEHGFQYIEIEAKNIFHLKTTKDILDIADKLLEKYSNKENGTEQY